MFKVAKFFISTSVALLVKNSGSFLAPKSIRPSCNAHFKDTSDIRDNAISPYHPFIC